MEFNLEIVKCVCRDTDIHTNALMFIKEIIRQTGIQIHVTTEKEQQQQHELQAKKGDKVRLIIFE